MIQVSGFGGVPVDGSGFIFDDLAKFAAAAARIEG
jgi:hypothetical protein